MVDHGLLSRVIAVGNGKGGVGKTSFSANFAGICATAHKRTLLIDLDPQGNLGEDLGYTWSGRGDNGQGMVADLLGGAPLRPTITDVRPDLDVVCGGEAIEDLDAALLGRQRSKRDSTNLLAESVAQVADEYDLVVIDTPPTNVNLQELALAASRWLLVPTAYDASSIRGLAKIAQRVADVRAHNPYLEILGVVLFGMPSGATAVRRKAEEQIQAALGGVAPLFDGAIRHSSAVAAEARDSGRLTYEIAEQAEQAEAWYEALRNGREPTRVPGSAGVVTEDYLLMAEQILQRIAAAESAPHEEAVAQ